MIVTAFREDTKATKSTRFLCTDDLRVFVLLRAFVMIRTAYAD
jgi:hypothetical protein